MGNYKAPSNIITGLGKSGKFSIEIASLGKIAGPHHLCKQTFKVGLHYSDDRSELVPSEEQKNIFYILKRL
jgi:hypothetical protein